MKTFKLTIFSLAMLLLVFTSCTNNESVIEEPQNTEESEAIKTALFQLKSQFNDDGNVNESENPAGNIIFDFCFDFVYPLTLSYNTGTTVTVENLDGLIDVMFNSTEDLFINGIAFPFNVETFNETTNTIEVVTINDENEFIVLLESCSFNDFEPCECYEDYNPVCVEISDPNGDTFMVTYPNACYAACDGFTETDFSQNCEQDYFSDAFGFDCFTLNYPLSIIVDGDTVAVNSDEELGTTLYNVYTFDFVYPFTITLNDDSIVTINDITDFEIVLTDCFGDIGNDCVACENEPADPVCIEFTDPNGNVINTVFPNMCFAECQGFSIDDVVDCD